MRILIGIVVWAALCTSVMAEIKPLAPQGEAKACKRAPRLWFGNPRRVEWYFERVGALRYQGMKVYTYTIVSVSEGTMEVCAHYRK